MITIFLDMDSVICDFMKHYHMVEPRIDSPKKFHKMVLEYQIFEKLDWMPNGEKLIQFLDKLDPSMFKLEILSSLGTHTPEVAEQAKKQKEFWLASHDIDVKNNFVNTWAHKYRYATKYSMIIDDRGDVCEDFIRAGGQAVVYIDHKFDEMIVEIESTIQKLVMMKRQELQTEDNNARLHLYKQVN